MPNAKLVLGIVVCSLSAACFSSTTPLDSTQTGNPPVIRTDRIALRVSRSDVRVIGERGAIEPAGAKVEVTNLATGEIYTTTAAADGSFEVRVGSANQVYSVRGKAGEQNSRPVFVIRGTATVGDGRDGSLSCEERGGLAEEVIARVSADADRSCKRDSDCTPVRARASCYQRCLFEYVSDEGRAEIERVSRDIDANLCVDYEADACSHPLPKCTEPPAPRCRMGQCEPTPSDDLAASCDNLAAAAGKRLDAAVQAADKSCHNVGDCVVWPTPISCRGSCRPLALYSLASNDAMLATAHDIDAQECAAFETLGCSVGEPTCDDRTITVNCIQNVCKELEPGEQPPPCGNCLDQLVEWGLDAGGGVTHVSHVLPCARFERIRISSQDGNAVQCEAQVDQCGEIASLGAIWVALQHPDVEALATRNVNPIQFGDARSPEKFYITIGVRKLTLGGPCDGAQPDCIPTPVGVQALRELLQNIDQLLGTPTWPCASVED